MKRNNATIREGRRTKAGGKSRYATKLMSGKMMYGPGCCGHTRSPAQVEAAKEEARRNGHFSGRAYIPREEM